MLSWHLSAAVGLSCRRAGPSPIAGAEQAAVD